LETYAKGLNKFHDLTRKEFLLAHTGLRKPKRVVYYKALSLTTSSKRVLFTSTKLSTTSNNLPSAIDYRNISGFVQPVRDQGNCGFNLNRFF
jgi:hypothetical protein